MGVCMMPVGLRTVKHIARDKAGGNWFHEERGPGPDGDDDVMETSPRLCRIRVASRHQRW
jgi:hypothetical protein